MTFYLQPRIRYFTYLSETKVRMLYNQIPKGHLHDVAVRLSIKLPLVGVEVEKSPGSPETVDLLRLVLEVLDERGEIGTVDKPRAYFAGRLPLRDALWYRVAYYSGRTAKTIVGMGGSENHLSQRHAGLPLVPGMGSTAVGMDEALRKVFATPGDDEAAEHTVWAAAQAAVRTTLPTRPMEFVARRILHSETSYLGSQNIKVHPDFEDMRSRGTVPFLLGTPLYVADAD